MKITNLLLFSLLFTSSNFSLCQTWTQIPSGTSKNLNTITFPTTTIGYIGGEDSLILKTTDGGQTWLPLIYTGATFFPNGYDINKLIFVTEMVGFMTIGPYGGTYKTTDGGLTWVSFDGIYTCFNAGLYFFDENNGFLGGSGCFSGEIINKLVNGIWTETNVTPTFIVQDGKINNFDFSTTDMGLATGTGKYFFRTIDGGLTWDTIPNTLNDTDTLSSVLFVNNSTVLASYTSISGGNNGVLISYDTGITWQQELNSATFFYPNMFATEKAGNGHIFIAGEPSFTSGGTSNGLIYESDGSVTNWMYSAVNEGIRDLASYGDSVTFAVGKNGYIIVNQNLSLLENQAIKANNDFEIYPNPSKDEITLNLTDKEWAKIEVVNTLGQQVFSLNSEEKNSSVKISNLPSGLYFVKIQFNKQTQVKSFILY